MKKTVKKTLSIILTILMIVTTIPFAFAAECEHDYKLDKDIKTSVSCNLCSEEIYVSDSRWQEGTYENLYLGNVARLRGYDAKNDEIVAYYVVKAVEGEDYKLSFDWAINQGYLNYGKFKLYLYHNDTEVISHDFTSTANDYSNIMAEDYSYTADGELQVFKFVYEKTENGSWEDDGRVAYLNNVKVTCLNEHNFENDTCTVCGDTCETLGHNFENGTCTVCGGNCETLGHNLENDTCTVCGGTCDIHDFENGTCTVCGGTCDIHDLENGTCTVCGGNCETLGHDFEDGTCTVCGITGGSCGDNVTYTYDSETGKLIIEGTGAMTDYSSSGSPFYNYAIKTVVIKEGVTSIGSYAFRNCTSLESVTIGNGVKSIGSYAFAWCTSLASVTIPDSVTIIGSYAFADCTSLASVTIPDSVTSIGSYAFYYCTSLANVTIGNGVTSIGEYAFEDCISLKSVTIPDSVTSIGNYAFRYCTSLESVTIPDSVTSIGMNAFLECTQLKSVTIGNSVTSIGEYAFEDCISLASVSVPCTWNENPLYRFDSSVDVTVRDHSFTSYIESEAAKCEANKKETASCNNGCGETHTREVENTALGHDFEDGTCTVCGGNCETLGHDFEDGTCTVCGIIVGSCGDNVTYTYDSETGALIIEGIGAMTDYINSSSPFYNSAIKTVVIKEGVTSIGSYAFRNCTSLANVTIGNSVTSIGVGAFSRCTSLASVTISNSVTRIGDWAFYYCTSLASVTIPDSVTSIGDYAFRICTSLESVTIPDSVTSIGDDAFYYCTSLASVTIPDSVTSIGDYAFADCTSLESITIPDSVTSIGMNAFYGCTSLASVSVPCTWNENPLYSFDSSVDVTVRDHSFTNYEITEAAKCEANAEETAACDNNCGETDTREVENTALGHDIIDDVYVAPTCTETGLTEGSYCSRCDDMTVEQEEIEALGHADADGDNVCDNCDYTFGCEYCEKEHKSIIDDIICKIKRFFVFLSNFLAVVAK